MLAAILATVISCYPTAVGVAGPVPRVHAVFIDPWNEMKGHSQADWNRIVQAAREIGVRAIIIKKLVTINRHNEVIRDFTDSPLVERIIAAAGSDVDVYIGVATQEQISTSSFPTLKSESLRVAKRVSKLHFKGWYLPVEAWNFAKGSPQIKAFHNFYCELVNALPRRQGVIASPFVNPSGIDSLSSPVDAAAVFEQVFGHTGITTLLIQDGTGGRADYEGGAAKWDIDRYLAAVQPYFSQISRRLQQKNVDVWVNVEAFEGKSSAEPARFHKQLFNVPSGFRVAMFDFYHHMNPVTPDQSGSPESALPCRQRLYLSYQAWDKRRGQ